MHPAEKQCNYSYAHPSSIQCNAATEINSLKTSVSNGKSAIASAITDKGVSTASDATFQTMANNISSIITSSWYTEFSKNVASAVGGVMGSYELNVSTYNYILFAYYDGSNRTHVRISQVLNGGVTNLLSYGNVESYNVAMYLSGGRVYFGPGYSSSAPCYLSFMAFKR